MNEILIYALANRIDAGLMTIEQTPEPYKTIVLEKTQEEITKKSETECH